MSQPGCEFNVIRLNHHALTSP